MKLQLKLKGLILLKEDLSHLLQPDIEKSRQFSKDRVASTKRSMQTIPGREVVILVYILLTFLPVIYRLFPIDLHSTNNILRVRRKINFFRYCDAIFTAYNDTFINRHRIKLHFVAIFAGLFGIVLEGKIRKIIYKNNSKTFY